MADRLYTEPRLAELYDTLCAGRPDFAFYLPLVMEAGSVLDVGCGTGELLIAARDAGHAGRLTGLDPADAMLGVARRRAGVEWVLARDWERWTGSAITDASGTPVRVDVEVKQVTAERVTFTQTYTSPGWAGPEVSWSTLRFLGVAELAGFLEEAGLEVEAQYGGWNREPLTEAAPEIITFAAG
ncbi:class I SAM-dependent methyltransferase [Nonomuraea endophytica]|uniref:SAM-dependent methyltransferase n=1 Tax=Nonomuraea endophytica TaxID=714136 RepID=A0A7W8EG53_9ACTN|nr:class I SAM-dependent methyltransferase [Nonomuraea endophytica]MBB5078041.1 SAM-dependent methyltransferase [Nonomuraea endophytica]